MILEMNGNNNFIRRQCVWAFRFINFEQSKRMHTYIITYMHMQTCKMTK